MSRPTSPLDIEDLKSITAEAFRTAIRNSVRAIPGLRADFSHPYFPWLFGENEDRYGSGYTVGVAIDHRAGTDQDKITGLAGAYYVPRRADKTHHETVWETELTSELIHDIEAVAASMLLAVRSHREQAGQPQTGASGA
ncbi:hypothetical protein [Nonomuraea sp. NPDC049400]|uniref:hypothetical protein n=1 Tax=Nonomuraea sp. NPDC049400 TaxID=3364352 RepID=UPI0037AFC0E8